MAVQRVEDRASGDTRNAPAEAENFDFGFIAFLEEPSDKPHPEHVAFIERRL